MFVQRYNIGLSFFSYYIITESLGLLDNVTSLGNVDTIQELSDILVSDSTDLLDVSTGLGNVLQRVTLNNQLILLGGGDGSLASLPDLDLSESLLSQEVSNLDVLLALLVNDVNVDREVRVNESHLVLETNGDTLDQVGNQRLDGSQSSNVLSVTIVDSDLDLFVGHLGEGNVDVSQVLAQLASWSSDGDQSGLDLKRNAFWNVQSLGGLDVLHALKTVSCSSW
ncbi:hypothetical protein OGAPHI_003994 [Ogataea philodendri]|uniref:Uncharacterized protein n=1 Tax=Ogataea philodendri TaxID=1378263 RepID=A0A9P8T4K1_9ASCO|nr:uncharacterized protein OGAPHI_003994 [Ogataea philodendri]KAH3665806.1 hypothetical protein OGAPHI_003994 [Ogataea philodendri]